MRPTAQGPAMKKLTCDRLQQAHGVQCAIAGCTTLLDAIVP